MSPSIDSIRALFEHHERIHAAFPLARREHVPPVVRYIQRQDRLSFILHSDLAGHDADAIIAREADYFDRLGVEVEWKVFDHDTPADLVSRLVAHGFAAEEAQFQMVLPLADMPAPLAAPLTHDVRRLAQDAEFDSFMRDIDAIMRDVWQEDMSWLYDHLRSQYEYNPAWISLYVAYVNGVPASTAWANYPENSPFASLYGGSTREAYRSAGLYTALVAVRAQEAKARGYDYLSVDCSPMSRAVLQKLGFLQIGTMVACVRKSAR
jgi:GNAT superfamily N-acetyltransferase